MTDPVAGGLKTTPSFSQGVGLGSAADAAEAGKTLPPWRRAAADTELSSTSGSSTLKSGVGPRPGGLDGAPVRPQGSDEAKKPPIGKLVGSRLKPTVIANAAREAIKNNLLQNKWRVFFHPKTSIALAIYGFFRTLIKGDGKVE